MTDRSDCAKDLFNVIAIDNATHASRVLAAGKTRENAEAIVKFAVYRRGVDDEFYSIIPADLAPETEKSR